MINGPSAARRSPASISARSRIEVTVSPASPATVCGTSASGNQVVADPARTPSLGVLVPGHRAGATDGVLELVLVLQVEASALGVELAVGRLRARPGSAGSTPTRRRDSTLSSVWNSQSPGGASTPVIRSLLSASSTM